MIQNIEKHEIEEAVRTHWRLQMGSYFASIHDLDGAIYNLGAEVEDYYWNYAGMINTTDSDADALIERVISFAKEQNRDPAFYIDPSTLPGNFVDNLTAKGFEGEEDEIWMKFDAFPDNLSSPDIEIRPVSSSDDMDVFLDVFHESYEMLEEGEVSTPYGDSLLRAFGTSPDGVDIRHFIGNVSGEAVCISSIYISGSDAGLYNVGTRPNFTGRGYGGELSVHAMKSALDQGINNLILQTELGENAEKLYKKLGFSQAFSGVIWSRP